MSGVTSPRAPAAPSPVALPQGLARLPKKEQQFVDFLILYPQYFGELQQAGLLEVFDNPAIAHFVRLVEEVSQEATCQSELLLERALDEQVRVYIAQVLTRDMASPDEQEEHAKRMYSELVRGLQADRKKQDAAVLQEQINQAESLGNTRLLMELLRRKQELQQKSEEE